MNATLFGWFLVQKYPVMRYTARAVIVEVSPSEPRTPQQPRIEARLICANGDVLYLAKGYDGRDIVFAADPTLKETP